MIGIAYNQTYGAFTFALFYWLVDVKGWQGWSFFFRVIGVNSITIDLSRTERETAACRSVFWYNT